VVLILSNISFYIMNSKGLFVLSSFIKKYGVSDIEFVVSERNLKIEDDCYNEIKNIALENNLVFYNRKEISVIVERGFKGYKFAIGWRWLIENQDNLIVFHDSLLPKYRGFAPLVNALINEEMKVGVTALHATKDYDAGDIIDQKSIEIQYPIKIKEAIEYIQPLYFSLVDNIFYKIKNKIKIESSKQIENEATFSLWLDEQDYFIDWSWPAYKIKRFIDSVSYPYGNARAYLNGEVILFKEADVFEDVNIEHRERHIGKIVFYRNEYPVIVCDSGLLLLKEFTSENSNPIKINFRSRFL